MSAAGNLITFLPARADDPQPYWIVNGEEISERGNLYLDGRDNGMASAVRFDNIIALVPPADASLRWTEMGAMPARQAETAARVTAEQNSLGHASDMHIAAQSQSRNQASGPSGSLVCVAAISQQRMQTGLNLLSKAGINPDIVTPMGAIFDDQDTGFLQASLGDHSVLIGRSLRIADEESLRTAVVGSAQLAQMDADAVDDALMNAIRNSPINLRSGKFAKSARNAGINAAQWRVLARLILTGLIFSLLLGLVTLWSYSSAEKRENARALALAQKYVPGANNVETVQDDLEKALTNAGSGGLKFTAPLAGLYSALQGTRDVTLKSLRYNGDGIMAFTLAAPQIAPVNAVLITLQQRGYKVTATPRQDASGLAMADISMRAQ
jgi:general secretion pathway protein L